MEESQKTSLWESGLIWFGAAVSLAEIMAGTLLAPLGWSKGLTAIVLGHVIGCALLYAAGIIGVRTKESAMRSTAVSFGSMGARFFALLNLIQLVGWTAVMIAGGAVCAEGLYPLGIPGWCAVFCGLILIWTALGIGNVGKLNTFTMSALFLLTLFMCRLLMSQPPSPPAAGAEAMSFGAALELSIAMPLSWLPLLADYTRHAKAPRASTAVSVVVYGITSCWMYSVGLALALFAGGRDVAQLMSGFGFGWAALIIVVLSTVTTTFLDVYSAGVSAECLCPVKQRLAAMAACIIGAVLAATSPVNAYEEFLYFIGSAFAPMITILIADVFVFGRDLSKSVFSPCNAVLWVIGVILYRVFLKLDTPLGNTLPGMLILFALCLLVGVFRSRAEKQRNEGLTTKVR